MGHTLAMVAACSIIVVTAIILFVSHHAIDSRKFANPPVITYISTPKDAYGTWMQSGVHGRVILLFDDYPHMRGLAFYLKKPELTDFNLIEYSIFQNILRKIYLVVHDSEWQTFIGRTDIGKFRADRSSGGEYLFTMSGVPLIALPASRVPAFDEQVLVYVNSHYFPFKQAQQLLAGKRISSDCFVVLERGAR